MNENTIFNAEVVANKIIFKGLDLYSAVLKNDKNEAALSLVAIKDLLSDFADTGYISYEAIDNEIISLADRVNKDYMKQDYSHKLWEELSK